MTPSEPEVLAADLRQRGVLGVTIGWVELPAAARRWVDNNGIVRSRTVPACARAPRCPHRCRTTSARGRSPVAARPAFWLWRPPTTSSGAHLLASDLVRDVLGEELLGAFVACRDADAAWAADRSTDEVVDSLRWQY